MIGKEQIIYKGDNMENKYGFTIREYTIKDYYNSLIGKVYKLLPMFEKNNPTIEQYFKNLIIELSGADKVFMEKKEFLELVNILEGMMLIDSHKDFKSMTFKCISIIQKLLDNKEE
jgi:hypothetical protein